MKILALDTSTQLCSLAISENDTVIATKQSNENYAHNGLLFTMLESLLNEAGVSLEQIDLLAIGQGPGSFTGLRIGVSAWKAVAFASGIPLLPICSLKAIALKMADQVEQSRTIRVFMDARQNDAFTSLYRIDNGIPTEIDPIQVVERSVIKELSDYSLGCGNLSPVIFDVKYFSEVYPTAESICKLAYMERNNQPANQYFEPSYYKEFQVKHS